MGAGKAFTDVMQALRDLGLGDAQLADLGVRVLKIGLLYPLEPRTVREFARFGPPEMVRGLMTGRAADRDGRELDPPWRAGGRKCVYDAGIDELRRALPKMEIER